jgi:hypothetical protein
MSDNLLNPDLLVCHLAVFDSDGDDPLLDRDCLAEVTDGPDGGGVLELSIDLPRFKQTNSMLLYLRLNPAKMHEIGRRRGKP